MPDPQPAPVRDLRPPAARHWLRPIAGHALAVLLALLAPSAAVWAAAASVNLSETQAAGFAEQAKSWQRQLAGQVMPYWYDRAIDRDFGGYLLEDALNTGKLLVTQARLVWAFAHAHRLGLGTAERDYLEAAAQGFRFLRDHFLDPEHGGYVWATNRPGQPINERKFLYGQAFVIYALVEYHRASGDPEALRQATELFRIVQAHGRDPQYGGWGEHFERDWRPLVVASAPAGTGAGAAAGVTLDVGIAGTKSGNAYLHWMEALTALDRLAREALDQADRDELGLEAALGEALDLSLTHFFPAKPGQAYPYRNPDWSRPLGGRFREISYGQNVAFAWLMLDAERVLGRAPSWERFDALLQHALAYGYDHEQGGLYQLGFANRPAALTDKVWWVQAELLAALTESLSHRPNPDYARALEQLLGFLTAHQIDPKDGIWFDTVAADGALRRPDKAHDWKAGYHDLRAMAKFVQTFGPGPGADPAAPR